MEGEDSALRLLAQLGVEPNEGVRQSVQVLVNLELFHDALNELRRSQQGAGTPRDCFLAIASRLADSVMEEDDYKPTQLLARLTQTQGVKRQLPTPESSQELISPATPPAKRQQLQAHVTPVEPPSPAKSVDSPTAARHRPAAQPGHDEPFIVCPAGASQASFNYRLERLPWLCTFFMYSFLTRANSTWSWKQIDLTRLKDLTKSDRPVEEGMDLIRAIVRDSEDLDSTAFGDETAMRLLISESEKELASFADLEAVAQGRGRSLGSFDADSDGFTGGRIKYDGKITLNSARQGGTSTEALTLRLSAPTLTQSCHFSRRFGSDCVLRLRFASAKNGRYLNATEEEELHHFCQRPLVIAGRTFRLVYNNDGVLYFAAINPVLSRLRSSTFTKRFLHSELSSLETLCQWWGEPQLNGHQKLVKWLARPHLLFSPTQPVAKIEDIQSVQDIVSPLHTGNDLPAHVIMTDGVCWLSCSAMKQAQKILKLEGMPSALQARIFGSKGVWTAHSSLYFDGHLGLGIRPSQRKIQLSPNADESWRILNVVRPSKLSHPANLSYQLLPLLTSAGVPVAILAELQKESLADAGTALMEWAQTSGETRQEHVLRLIQAVFATGLVGGRLRRKEGAAGRARGFGNFEIESDEEEDEDVKQYDGYGSECTCL